MIIFSGKIVRWEDFIKQLEPEEIKAYEQIRFMAQELEEPQKVVLEGITIGLMWPNGAFQSAREIEHEPNVMEWLGEF